MNEQSITAMMIIISAMPALGIGLACVTRRWMPEQYSKSANSAQLQSILGLGLLAISTSLMAFGIVFPLLTEASLSMVTMSFVIIVNIEAIAMVLLLYRAAKKKT